MRTQWLGAVTAAAVLSLMLVAAPVTAAVTAAEGCFSNNATERSLAAMTNKSRSAKNLPRLSMDPELSFIARRHSQSMARTANLVHSNNLGSKITGWTSWGENVGYGNSASQLHPMFMDSPSHRANIMNSSYRNVGIGTVQKGNFLWVTVIFQGRVNPGTTLDMPSC